MSVGEQMHLLLGSDNVPCVCCGGRSCEHLDDCPVFSKSLQEHLEELDNWLWNESELYRMEKSGELRRRRRLLSIDRPLAGYEETLCPCSPDLRCDPYRDAGADGSGLRNDSSP